MGADISLIIETVAPNLLIRHVEILTFRLVYRGLHDDVFLNAGSGEPTGCCEEIVEILKEDSPYWIQWMPAADFVAFADAHFGKPTPMYDDDDSAPYPVLDVSKTFQAIVEVVRHLTTVRETRVIYWYGP